MAAKKIVSSPFTPISVLVLIIFWPSIQAAMALAYIKLSPLQIDSNDLSGPRQFQRYFQQFGVPLEMHSVEFFQSRNVFQISVPLGLNIPFAGRLEYSFDVEIKST